MNATLRILTVAAFLGLSSGSMSVLAMGAQAEAATVAVTIDAPTEVVTGSSFQVDVDITTVTAFDAGQFDISFDEAVIHLDAVGAGQIGSTAVPVDVWNMTSPGVCRIVANVPNVPGVSGSGRLATLTFTAKGPAGTSSSVAISNGFLNNNLGTEIATAWTGDSVNVWNSVAIVNDSLPDASVGTAYSARLAATGGDGSYAWLVTSGSLPSGISLSLNGSLSGTPTTVGSFSVTFGVTDGELSATKVLSIVVSPRLGDADGNGVVNTADITKVERIIVQLEVTASAADANRDGIINTADITKVERIIAGLS